MLVLGRKVGEIINIGGNYTIEVQYANHKDICLVIKSVDERAIFSYRQGGVVGNTNDLYVNLGVNSIIVIDEIISVMFIGLKNGAARIGIEAPKEIKILRKELING